MTQQLNICISNFPPWELFEIKIINQKSRAVALYFYATEISVNSALVGRVPEPYVVAQVDGAVVQTSLAAPLANCIASI